MWTKRKNAKADERLHRAIANAIPNALAAHAADGSSVQGSAPAAGRICRATPSDDPPLSGTCSSKPKRPSFTGGGRHAIGNVLPVCATCNLSKHDKLLAEWRYRRMTTKAG